MLHIDGRLTVRDPAGLQISNDTQRVAGDQEYPVTKLQLNWSIPGKLPIFHIPFSITDNKPVKLTAPTDGRMGKPTSYLLGYEIASPRTPLKSTFTLIKIRSGSVRLSEDGYFGPGELPEQLTLLRKQEHSS